MIKQLFLTLALVFTLGTSFAQRIVYVDTEYILTKVSTYKEAQVQLEEMVATWQTEITEKESAVIAQKAAFEEKKALMPDNLKIKEQENIEKAQEALNQLKQKRFGVKGDLFKQQQNLIKPIQDKIYNAVKKMAEQRDYDFVLDKSTGVSILFVKPQFDMSDEVLRIMNLSPEN